jgi:HD-GYP domain-containing protein (c-di-GMP phosphodiesterase class II)
VALTEIDISELKVGMYVSKVVKQTGQVKVVTHGWVKNEKIINVLKKRGVETLEIDDGKQENKEVEPEQTEAVKQPTSPPTKEPVPLAKELKNAGDLLVKAKKVQRNIFSQLASGGKTDLSEAELIVGAIIDSLENNQDALVLLICLRNKNQFIMEHCLSTSIYTCIICQYMGYDREITKQLTLAAMLHDVGKMHVNQKILNKPSKLTQQEFKHLTSSIAKSYKMLTNTIGMENFACEMVLSHKEHLDGTGYPRGLKDDDINEYARILAVADAYDALTHQRPYAAAVVPAQAFKILDAEQTCFDQGVVQALIHALGQYPVGSLVILSNNRLAVVKHVDADNPTKPLVTEFYNANSKHFIPLKDINLADKYAKVELSKAVEALDYGIDVSKFFNEILITQFSQ